MVTKYDIFLYLAEKKVAKTPEIMKHFKKRQYEYANVYRLLSEVVKEKLATKSRQGFQVKLSKKSQLLYQLLTYCVSNGVGYNYLMNKRFAEFVSKALVKIEFTAKDFRIDSKTFKKYTDILFSYGLLIKISSKPFKARILWNVLFTDLLQYFDLSVLVEKEKRVSFIDDIKKELKIFNRHIAKNERKYHTLLEEYKIKFIHSSLSLEGNPITLPDTIKILKNKIIPKDLRDFDVREIQNYQTALKTMISDAAQGNTLNQEKILNYHFLAMQHKPHIAGKIRKISVHIKGNPNFKIAPVSEIEILFQELMEEYNKFTAKKQDIQAIIDFAAYFHNQFQYIHPFEDGNSRTTRLITFHLFQYFKIPVLDIPLGLLDQYLSNTKSYKRRDDKALQRTLQYIILYNLKAINKNIS
jgi:fido (protein-threonine AMPylation protein)